MGEFFFRGIRGGADVVFVDVAVSGDVVVRGGVVEFGCDVCVEFVVVFFEFFWVGGGVLVGFGG